MDPIYFGVIGGCLFVIAWLYETWEEIHKHKMFQDLKFAYMNLVGVASIFVYSYYTNSTLFFYINFILLFFISFEIVYSKYLQKKHRKSK